VDDVDSLVNLALNNVVIALDASWRYFDNRIVAMISVFLPEHIHSCLPTKYFLVYTH